METAYLGLGSNLGNRAQNLRIAMQLLSPEIRISKRSSVYETEPMYMKEQPKFLNMVIAGTTELSAANILKKLKTIEKQMGEHEHNQPRIIDLDLLFYGDEVIETPELSVPHPKIAEREFVLRPMMDIAPDFVHPVLGVTIAQLFVNSNE